MKDILLSFLIVKWSRVLFLLLWDEYFFSYLRFFFFFKVLSLILVFLIFLFFIFFVIKRRNFFFLLLLINCVVDFVCFMMNNFVRFEIKRFFLKIWKIKFSFVIFFD